MPVLTEPLESASAWASCVLVCCGGSQMSSQPISLPNAAGMPMPDSTMPTSSANRRSCSTKSPNVQNFLNILRLGRREVEAAEQLRVEGDHDRGCLHEHGADGRAEGDAGPGQ